MKKSQSAVAARIYEVGYYQHGQLWAVRVVASNIREAKRKASRYTGIPACYMKNLGVRQTNDGVFDVRRASE